ncbi:hypothetical protein D9758_001501 [Tetrapyrgos nigripes]|uniref:FAD-binding domain-containing protein n=1 Tax=Tetrapyrgos nigripes TaxID=182062 RepID=A0A8H5GXV1_9AGAR|nr:hypothetical protein D9758_001501 [Tetrapyrgos nigripes]
MENRVLNRVLIIGAGTIGLLIAQNLKKLGIPYAVFEQDAAIDARPRDWSFGIYWTQTTLKECLPDGIDEKYLIDKVQVDRMVPTEDLIIPLFNSWTGEILKPIPTPYGLRLQRRTFMRALTQGLDVHYGKRLAEVKTDGQTVTAIFEDGTKEEGKLLIGCDGAHSKVRDFLLGPEKAALRSLPFLCNQVMTKLPKETALAIRKVHPRNMNSTNPDGVYGWVSIHDCTDLNPENWVFMLLMTWVEKKSDSEDAGRLDASNKSDVVQTMKKFAEKFAEPWKSFFLNIPNDAIGWHNRMSDWPTQKWDNRNGTVTLAGDAAHPMTFHRGQGLNNAIHDAYTLMRALGDHPPSQAGSFKEVLEVYEKDVTERGREAVLASEENSNMMHDWKRVNESDLFRLGVKPQ